MGVLVKEWSSEDPAIQVKESGKELHPSLCLNELRREAGSPCKFDHVFWLSGHGLQKSAVTIEETLIAGMTTHPGRCVRRLPLILWGICFAVTQVDFTLHWS